MKTRRDFIKMSLVGAGALALSSPLSAFAAEGAVGSMPKRFVFIRKSNGLRPFDIVPTNLSDEHQRKEKERQSFEVALDKHELPPFLREFEADKKHMTILQGLSAKMSMNGHHSWHSVMGLCKAKYGALNLLKRTSIDFELAKLYPSPLGHVELSFAGNRHGIVPGFSIPAPNRTNYCYADAITAYENLFKSVLNPSELEVDNAMLAHLQNEEKSLINIKAGDDKKAYAVHGQSLQDIQNNNKELTRMGKTMARYLPDRDFIYGNGTMLSPSVDRQDAMTEVLVGVLASGLTNVVTYTIDDLFTKQTGLPGIENQQVDLHAVGHGNSFGGKSADQVRELIRIHHFKQVKTIMNALREIPEGAGTMFDNTMIMYFPEGGEAHHAQGTESPWIIMSGKNCKLDIAGRYIRLPYYMETGHLTLGNWYTTLLNAHGNPIEHYGDLDPALSRAKLPQEGSIKRFIKA